MKLLLSTWLITGILLLRAGAADSWPDFRGPNGDGHADSCQPPTHWSARSGIRWTSGVLGSGWSSPVIGDSKVYLTTAVEEGDQVSLRALCFDLDSGKELWQKEVIRTESVAIHRKNSQASPSPVLDEGQVFVHFGPYGTAALKASDGTVLWTKTNLRYHSVHGNGGSPIIHRSKLIFANDGARDPFVVALSARNGAISWRVDRNIEVRNTFSFSTPLLVSTGWGKQAIIPGSGAVVSYDPNTGKEIWRFRYGEGYSVVPRPVHKDGIVYVSSGFDRATLFAVRINGHGDVTDTHLVWKDDKTIPKESSPILVDDLLYYNDDKGILNCLNAATGEVYYRERIDGSGPYSASPVYAGGHLYFHNAEGVTTVVKPGKTFVKVAENRLEEYGLSSFAVLSDSFVIRTKSHLMRIGK